MDFNPRSPHGERLNQKFPMKPFKISIHAPRTGSDAEQLAKALINNISIHAPRTGSDKTRYPWTELTEISIHAPRTGSDAFPARRCSFLSISIHAPRTGSDKDSNQAGVRPGISIHAPRTGSDVTSIQPAKKMEGISIHAPRTGSDETLLQRGWFTEDFNPRSPHGERRKHHWGHLNPRRFQSTLPARGATAYHRLTDEREAISIHAPRTGSDRTPTGAERFQIKFQSTLPARGATLSDAGKGRKRPHFNPRSPHGERPTPGLSDAGKGHISIHAPRTGSDELALRVLQILHISIHAPRTGSDGTTVRHTASADGFQSTLPARGATCPV